jgi:hypothetical protein
MTAVQESFLDILVQQRRLNESAASSDETHRGSVRNQRDSLFSGDKTHAQLQLLFSVMGRTITPRSWPYKARPGHGAIAGLAPVESPYWRPAYA